MNQRGGEAPASVPDSAATPSSVPPKRAARKRAAVVHRSLRQADEADLAYYWGLSPRRRLQILLALNEQWPKEQDAPSG